MSRGRPPASLVELVAAIVIRLRFVIVPGWIVAAVLATVYLPAPGEARGAALGSLVPENAPAAIAQRRSAELFAFPVLSNTAVVQRDPDGLTPGQEARVLERAARVTGQEFPELLSVPFALPVINTLGVFPGSRELDTTAITFLFFEPGTGLQDRVKLARWFGNIRIREDRDTLVGATGIVPARVEQGRLIEEALPLVEGATVLLIALVIGLTFRGIGAPILTLVAVAVAYLVALRVVAVVGAEAGVEVPREVEPILLVLLLGLVTDYCIFFLSGFRHRLREGDDRLQAAQRTTADFTPLIGTAGLIVALGAASLFVARTEFFRIFGPGLAIAVLVGLLASITFVPAVIAMFGRLLFLPSRPERTRPQRGPRRFSAVVWLSRTRLRAGAVTAVCVAGLLFASTGLERAELAVTPIRSLPDDSVPTVAAAAAREGFADGILMPTLILVERATGEGLARLHRLLEKRPAIGGVVGPGNIPQEVPSGVVRAPARDAARYVVLLRDDPLSSDAIADLEELRDEMPGMLAEAGIPGARVSFGGNTAIAEETIDAILRDLLRISIAVLVVNGLLLVLFLRSLLAPLYLLGASVLAVTAALGLTTMLFENELTYYVPFMSAVLLVSLGSDYNVFLVGRIWQEARHRPIREAIAVAAPRASRAISVAAIALAGSFALLGLVPLSSFHQFAFTMAVGVFLDAFVVRSYLVPALVALAGSASGWPGRFSVSPVAQEPT